MLFLFVKNTTFAALNIPTMYKKNYKWQEKQRGPSVAREASVKEVFSMLINEYNIEFDPFEYEIKEVWKELTGTLTDRLTRRIYVQGAILYVFVSSPALKHELMMVRGELCEKINQRFAEKYRQFQKRKILNNIIIK
ncbi:MAG: DUF721 domain-containing protein [Bacteroidales bacterium]|jgi:hypothetical protein|nr:DUF721 domain-containing protein [Bacteroidales bacterium]